MDVASGPQLLYRDSVKQESVILGGFASKRKIPREVRSCDIRCTFYTPSWRIGTCCGQAVPSYVCLVLGQEGAVYPSGK